MVLDASFNHVVEGSIPSPLTSIIKRLATIS